jgi:hypothetical protein
MSDICLTDEEAVALRQILAALAVIEERGLRHDRVIEVSQAMWQDILVRPAEPLMRRLARRLEGARG